MAQLKAKREVDCFTVPIVDNVKTQIALYDILALIDITKVDGNLLHFKKLIEERMFWTIYFYQVISLMVFQNSLAILQFNTGCIKYKERKLWRLSTSVI